MMLDCIPHTHAHHSVCFCMYVCVWLDGWMEECVYVYVCVCVCVVKPAVL